MTTNALAELDVDATTAKRAQYEGFEFDVVAPGILKVTNGSHENPEEHSYRVNIEGGVPVACECPADEYHKGACKHRVAVAIREPVLEAATAGDGQAVADGGIVVADDEGEVLEESEDDGRPEDCACAEFLADAGLPCWPCYREGFREAAAADTESEDNE